MAGQYCHILWLTGMVSTLCAAGRRGNGVCHGGGEAEAGQQGEGAERQSPGGWHRFFVDLFLARTSCFTSITGSTTFWSSKVLRQVADQSIKILEDQQDEYNFRINTLKNRGAETNNAQRLLLLGPWIETMFLLQRTKWMAWRRRSWNRRSWRWRECVWSSKPNGRWVYVSAASCSSWWLQELSKHLNKHVLPLCSTRPGCGDAAVGALERRPGPHLWARLRGAARVEATAADCLYRRSAQRLRGPAAELVSHLPAVSPPSLPPPPPVSSPMLSHLLSLPSSPPPATGSLQWPRASSRSASTWRSCRSWSRSSPTSATPSRRRRPSWRAELWSSSRTSSPGGEPKVDS